MANKEEKDINNIDLNDIEDFEEFEEFFGLQPTDEECNGEIKELDFNN
jgi:hypothetical protein